jgi:hypothetical protein
MGGMSSSDPAPPAPALANAQTAAQKWTDRIKPWHFLATLILGLIGGGLTMWFNIRSAAREAVTEEKFLGELAAKVRPSCIFDFQGAILSELGTAEYIGPISIQREAEHMFHIKIKGKKHLRFQPLVECISYEMHTVKAVRTEGYDWDVTLASTVAFMTDAQVKDFQFKLEILH